MTNVIVSELRQTAVDKIDMLFVIDNSISMADKQEILALAVPDLMKRLVDPVCVNTADASQTVLPEGGVCPQDFQREFEPIEDIHVGVITSSLGGFGAIGGCDDAAAGQMDYAHLLGSLPRGGSIQPGFLSWCTPDAASRGRCIANAESAGIQAFSDAFQNQVALVGDTGCGWEATLESWYRFLVEPNPWTEVVRTNCSYGGDMDASCVGPATDATGAILVDETLLAQRRAFMRPDSLLAIVMLTDENDCSFKATGQSWRLSQEKGLGPDGEETNRAYKGTSACAVTPNDPCCHSCGVTTPPAQCPTTMDDKGRIVGAGCEQRQYPAQEEVAPGEVTEDPINLRCFNQKQRFGVDYLYPTKRYTNALTLKEICPFAETLEGNATDSAGNRICRDEQIVPNPLYSDITYEERLLADPNAAQIVPRSNDLVFLAGIVGVPWQDLAVDSNADVLVYRTNRTDENAPPEARIDWNFVLGSDVKGAAYSLLEHPPGDPLMHEQIDPRENTRAEINGGEWNILNRDELQYACTFPLETERTCLSETEVVGTSDCDCTYYDDEEFQNPLCRGLTQVAAKAYPSIRPLQVLRDYGPNSIVASICPKNTATRDALDFGYRPAVTAIVDRLKEQLKDKCLPRALEVKDDGTVSCLIVEADPDGIGTCDTNRARDVVSESVAKQVRKRLLASRVCTTDEECERFTLCHITPLEPQSSEYAECLATENPNGDGWCYIDPAQGLGEMSQVEKCEETTRRKIRFAGAGKPNNGTITFFACAGARERVSSTP